MLSFQYAGSVPQWVAGWLFNAFSEYGKLKGKKRLDEILGFKNPGRTVFEQEENEEKNIGNIWHIAVIKSALSVTDKFACLVFYASCRAKGWESFDTVYGNFLRSNEAKRWKANEDFFNYVFGDDPKGKIEFLEGFLPKPEDEKEWEIISQDEGISPDEIKKIRKKIQEAISAFQPKTHPT